MADTVLNIVSSDISGNCQGKCNYDTTAYTNITSATCANGSEGLYIECSPSNITCMYNVVQYTLYNIALCSPCVVLYNGYQPEACILLVHANSSNSPLYVVIPIVESSSQTNSVATTALTEFVSAMASFCPKPGESTTNAFSSFPLPQIIPQSEFVQLTTSGVNVIVFGINGFIPLPQSTIQTLQSIISPMQGFIFPPGQQMFLNTAGPTVAASNVSDNLLYINCSPTDSSDQFVEVATDTTTTTTTPTPVTWTSVWEYIINNHLLLFVIVIAFLYALNSLIKNAFPPPKQDGGEEEDGKKV